MINGHSSNATDEFEIADVLLVANPRIGIDLKGVVVGGRVLKEAVVGVEHLLGQKVKPLPSQSAVVEADLVVKLDPQLCLQDVNLVRRELRKNVLKYLSYKIKFDLPVSACMNLPKCVVS